LIKTAGDLGSNRFVRLSSERGLNHHTMVTPGVAAESCATLLSAFFAARRQERGQ
jgi:tRNA(Arg) A34 adenosine deaminase TadA